MTRKTELAVTVFGKTWTHADKRWHVLDGCDLADGALDAYTLADVIKAEAPENSKKLAYFFLHLCCGLSQDEAQRTGSRELYDALLDELQSNEPLVLEAISRRVGLRAIK